MESRLIVFYSVGHGNWEYGNLPKGWKWSGGGPANPIRGPRESRFDREDTFYGDEASLEAARCYFQTRLAGLVSQGLIREFIVTREYRDGML